MRSETIKHTFRFVQSYDLIHEILRTLDILYRAFIAKCII